MQGVCVSRVDPTRSDSNLRTEQPYLLLHPSKMKTVRDSETTPAPAKKARVGGGDVDATYNTTSLEDEPNKGSVLRVKMKNFMTYGNVEFVPGRRLNLILGPNGTLASCMYSLYFMP